MPERPLVRIPGPRAHLRGTLALLERFEPPAALLRFLDRPEALPEQIRPEEAGLKYDGYLTRSRTGSAWGVAVSDRHETELWPALQRLVAELGGDYALDRALEVKRRLRADPSLCVAVGFDRPGAPPRLKIYVQERRWGNGIGTCAEVAAVLGELPGWIPDPRPIAVLTLGLLADGRVQHKVYLGGPTALEAARGSPAMDLAERMHAACPHPGYYYLTVRTGPVRYAINKIYNPVQVGFTLDGTGIGPAWDDVASLFRAAGHGHRLADLRSDLDELEGVRVVPTATALEDEGTSVDVYFAAWDMADR